MAGDHLKSTRALEFKGHAPKRQEVSVPGRHADGLGVRQAEEQALALVAVLLQATGGVLTGHPVVRAVAVAALLALPVRPEGLVGGQTAAVVDAAAVAAGDTKVVVQDEAVLTLAALLARLGARFPRVIQVGAGQRAAAGALIKVTVLWTGKS